MTLAKKGVPESRGVNVLLPKTYLLNASLERWWDFHSVGKAFLEASIPGQNSSRLRRLLLSNFPVSLAIQSLFL